MKSAFDTYVIEDQLGQGGSGRVFGVRGTTSSSLAAKVLDPDKATSERRKRFKNEILFGMRGGHRSIVPVLDYGTVEESGDTMTFFVMPRYSFTLRELIAGGLLPPMAFSFFQQLLDAVEAAHLLGVTHRDIKPENIFAQSASGPLLVGDFGIAQFHEDDLYTTVETGPSSRLANLQYAAPEQRRRNTEVDQSADVYALGLVANELFTGSVPHGTEFRRIEDVSRDHAFLDPMIDEMLRQDPRRRPQSIDEIKRRLIADQRAHVIRQRIDTISNTVVPTTDVTRPAPVTVKALDYRNRELIVELSEVPTPEFLDFYRQAANVPHILGHDPRTFNFDGRFVRLRAIDSQLPQILDSLKRALNQVSEAFPDHLARKAREKEDAERRRLEQAAEEERRRLKVLSGLRP